MNKFNAVFLTALLAAGTTMAKDSVAEKVAIKNLTDPVFLNKQEGFADQVKKEVLGETFKSERSEIMELKNLYGAFMVDQEKEAKSQTMEILEKTEEILRNTMEKMVDYVSDASKNALKEVKNQLPGALEKTTSVAKTIINYMMETMSAVMHFITTSIKKMMPTGDDPSKVQKISENEDEFKTSGDNSLKTGYELAEDNKNPWMKNDALIMLDQEGR